MIINEIIDEDCEQIIQENNSLKQLFGSTVMITGASGMIGSYFVYTLMKLNEKYDAKIKIVPVLRNINKLNEQIKSNKHVYPIIQDVTEKINYPEPIDYIIHAAGPTSPNIMKKQPVETNFANTLGTANTLLLAKDKNTKGYLFISSREIYGNPLNNEKYFTEDSFGYVNHLIPRNGYAEGKKAAENMCIGFKEEYGLNTKIIRLAHTYGPGINIKDGKVQSDFIQNVLNNENIVLKSDGLSIRTYTYISDAISAMLNVLLNGKDEVYNVSDENNEVSIKELAEILVSICPEKKLKLEFDIPLELNKGNASFKLGILSSEKIRKELNWKAKYSIKEGFERTIKHLKIMNK